MQLYQCFKTECEHVAQRTDAAARESLQRDRPAELKSPTFSACGSASPCPSLSHALAKRTIDRSVTNTSRIGDSEALPGYNLETAVTISAVGDATIAPPTGTCIVHQHDATAAEYDIASLHMVSVYCFVTKACARRPGAAASMELAGAARLRQARPSSACTFSARQPSTAVCLSFGPIKKYFTFFVTSACAASQAFERMHNTLSHRVKT